MREKIKFINSGEYLPPIPRLYSNLISPKVGTLKPPHKFSSKFPILR